MGIYSMALDCKVVSVVNGLPGNWLTRHFIFLTEFEILLFLASVGVHYWTRKRRRHVSLYVYVAIFSAIMMILIPFLFNSAFWELIAPGTSTSHNPLRAFTLITSVVILALLLSASVVRAHCYDKERSASSSSWSILQMVPTIFQNEEARSLIASLKAKYWKIVKFWAIVFLLGFALIFGLCAAIVIRGELIVRRIANVHVGMPVNRVRAILGSPDEAMDINPPGSRVLTYYYYRALFGQTVEVDVNEKDIITDIRQIDF
jgi:hypothetical protein